MFASGFVTVSEINFGRIEHSCVAPGALIFADTTG